MCTLNVLQLQNFLYSKESINFQNKFYDETRRYSTLLSKLPLTLSQEEQKKISTKDMLDLIDIKKKLSKEGQVFPQDIKITLFNPPAMIKYELSTDVFSQTIFRLGTERHREYCKRISDGEIIGGFALTEISHGSNAKSIQTTAKYDKSTKTFILNTPNFLAAKCWMGNVGKTATHIILYAQLVTPDNVNHGLHAFVVNIRDPQTLLPRAGILITDLGEKIGLEPIDNGLIMFHDYHIPKSNLLDKVADVSNDGTYIPRITEKHKQFGILMGILLSGRIRALGTTTVLLRNALSIAIRYATCVEPSGVLENQSQQIRLIPWLAVTYISHIMHNYLDNIDSQLNSSVDLMHEKLILELHALSSATKPVITWLARDGIQTCKEMCKTYGHLKGSCLADLYNLNDPMYTLEGDNNVLIQQTANWLLKLYEGVLKGDSINFPLSSVNFIKDAGQILNQKFDVSCRTDFSNPQNILNYCRWLTCYLLKVTYLKQKTLQGDKISAFWIKNESQVYSCRTLSKVYTLTFYMQRSMKIISEASDDSLKEVMFHLLSLYGIWNLQHHVHYFYQGGYANGPSFADLMEEGILTLCKKLNGNAVSLVNAITPPNFSLNSVLGYSDRNVFKRLESTITHTLGTFSIIKWGSELNEWKVIVSKL